MKITVNNKEYELDNLVIRNTAADEQELTITALRTEDFFEAYTSDNTYLTKLKKLAAANPKNWQITDIYESGGEVTGVRFKAPKRALSFRAGNIVELSDEERAARVERLKLIKK